MFEKVASFLFTLGLMGWNIYNIVRGHASVFTWIMLGVLTLGGLFELGAIFEAHEKNSQNAQNADHQNEGSQNAQDHAEPRMSDSDADEHDHTERFAA